MWWTAAGQAVQLPPSERSGAIGRPPAAVPMIDVADPAITELNADVALAGAYRPASQQAKALLFPMVPPTGPARREPPFTSEATATLAWIS